MFQWPVYRASLVLVTLVAVAGAAWLLAAPTGVPGIEVTIPEDVPSTSLSADASGDLDASFLTDINTASARELADTLPGIGEILARRIVAYREVNGPYARTDQLMGVRGIGPATYERLQPLVTAGE